MIADLKPYPEYKESGLPWLGQVPSTWRVVRNGSLFGQRNQTGYEELPILEVSLKTGVRVRDFENSTRKQVMSDMGKYKRAAKGDVAYNMMRMWQGAVGVSPVDGLVSPAYVVARPYPQVEPRFFVALFRTGDYMSEIDNCSRGIVKDRNRLYWDQFKQILSPCPPPAEQATIVRFLDWVSGRLERAIRAKRKVIALLNEQKQAIIHRAVTRGLDPSVPLKPSGIPWLGDIPQHWGVRRLKHISPRIGVGLVINPSSYFVDETHPEPIPMLLGNNITPNGFRLEKVRHIGADDSQRLGASRLTSGDVVVVRVGAPGVAAVIPQSLDGCNCASIVIVRKHSSFVSQWLAHVFNSPVMASQIDAVKYGAAQKQFNISDAVDFLFPMPPNAEQQEIVAGISERTAPLNCAVQVSEREIELLHEYRTRLVADVVTGKLDVREAAAQLPDEVEPNTAEAATDDIDETEPIDTEVAA